MTSLNLDQNILSASASAAAGDWAQAAVKASLDFRGAAELKRGVNLEAGIGVMGELSAALRYFLAVDLDATALYEQAPTFADNSDELARQCIRVALEETQKALLEMLITAAMNHFIAALGQLGISAATWEQSKPQRDALANLLRAVPREPFQPTSQNLKYWSDLTNAAVNVGIQLGGAAANSEEWVEPAAILWSAAQLLTASVQKIADAQARASFFGAVSTSAQANAFSGALPGAGQTPTAIRAHINTALGRNQNQPLDQDTLVEYLVRDGVIAQLLRTVPEAASLIDIFAGAGAGGAVATAKVIMRNINAFAPKADGSGYDAKASLRIVAEGLEAYIDVRVRTELQPILAAQLGDDPLVQLYIDEVILPSLLFTSRTLIRRTLDWGTGALTARTALREACASIVMKVLGRSAVVTADVLIAATLQQIGDELNRKAEGVRGPRGIADEYRPLVTATGADEAAVGQLIEESLRIAADLFRPQPPVVRAKMRTLMYDLLDTMPASVDDNWVEQLQHDLFIPNTRTRESIFELANLATKQLADLVARFATLVLARLAVLVLRELADFAEEIRRQLQQWIDELTRLAADPLAGRAKYALVAKVERLRLPPPFQQVLGLGATVSAELHAYPPLYAYDPAFQDGDPIAVARNIGGLVLLVRNLTLRAGPFGGSIKEAMFSLAAPGHSMPQTPRITTEIQLGRVTAPGLALESAKLTLATDPFTARLTGGMARLDLGLFRVEPLSGQGLLQVRVDAIRGDLSIDPARLVVPLLEGQVTARIHGATANEPFTYIADGPWSAHITLEGGNLLDLQVGGSTVLRIRRSDLQTARILRNPAGVISMELNLSGGAILTAFPGQAFGLTLRLAARSTLIIASNGEFALSSTLAAALSLKGLPITSLAAGASVNITQSGITLAGAISGGVLTQVTPVAGFTGTLTVKANGAMVLSGSATIQPLVAGPFRVESAAGGNITAAINNNGLSFSGARLRVEGVLGAAVNLPAFTMPADGNFSLAVNPPNMTVAGIPCASISFTLRRETVDGERLLSLQPFAATLNLPGLGQRVTGSINSAGNITLDYTGSLTLGGFTATHGRLHLRNNGLSAEGVFTLRYNTTTFGQVRFAGGISYDTRNNTVSYNLDRTSGGITIGNIAIPSPNLTLHPGGVDGATVLPFGGLQVVLKNLQISASGGLNFTPYTCSVDSGWVKFVDIPATDVGDVYARLKGAVEFRPNRSGLTVALKYTWAPWLVTADFPSGALNLPPANINRIPAPPRFSGSGSISSNGQFTVNTSFGGISVFAFKLW